MSGLSQPNSNPSFTSPSELLFPLNSGEYPLNGGVLGFSIYIGLNGMCDRKLQTIEQPTSILASIGREKNFLAISKAPSVVLSGIPWLITD